MANTSGMKTKTLCKCLNDTVVVERWAKRTAPNEYTLEDRHICPRCRLMKKIVLGQIDKNSDETRELLEKPHK